VFNLNGVPFIRGGHWNQTSTGFTGDSFRVSFLRVAEVPQGTKVEDATNYIDLSGQSQAWSPIELKELDGDAGVVVQYFSSHLQTDKGQVTISAMISNKVLQTSDRNQTAVLTPFRLKYNIEVDNFNYQGDNSHLVIVKRVDTMDVQGAYNGSLATTNGGKFQWSETVLNDGQVLKVGTMSVSNNAFTDQSNEDAAEDFDANTQDTSKFMAFDVGRGAQVIWDPSLNLQEDMYGSSDPSIDYNSYGFAGDNTTPVTVYNGQSSTVMNGVLPQGSGSNNNVFSIVGLVGAACLSMF